MPVFDTEFITTALLRAAQIGGRICMEKRHKASISFKPIEAPCKPIIALASSIVTDADLAVQEAILQTLLDCGLQDCIVQAEEDTALISKFHFHEGHATIFVDPIDGTLTYALGCRDWEIHAAKAGFERRLLQQTKERLDPRFYGIVLGALIPQLAPIAVCMLPELQTVFYSKGGAAFRNGTALKYIFPGGPTCVAIGRRLLDSNGESATPFASAGVNAHWFSGSAPAVLWQLFEGTCTSYVELACGFDAQLAAMAAQAAGLMVCDRNGKDIVFNPYGKIDSIIIASSTKERDSICEVLRCYS